MDDADTLLLMNGQMDGNVCLSQSVSQSDSHDIRRASQHPTSSRSLLSPSFPPSPPPRQSDSTQRLHAIRSQSHRLDAFDKPQTTTFPFLFSHTVILIHNPSFLQLLSIIESPSSAAPLKSQVLYLVLCCYAHCSEIKYPIALMSLNLDFSLLRSFLF